MEVLTSKWMIGALVFMAILLFLYLMGRKSVHTELIIEASPQQIWEVLMHEEAYPEWNQVLFPIAGKIEPGNRLLFGVTLVNACLLNQGGLGCS